MERPSSPPASAIRTWLQKQFPDAALITKENISSSASWKGAYILAIHLAEPVPISIKQTDFTLKTGWLTYAGSANGPGGVRARLARHFRHEKTLHWHVDQLTVRADQIFALAIEGGDECVIVDRLSCTDAMDFPIAGFGSSDCKVCRSHLMRLRKPEAH